MAMATPKGMLYTVSKRYLSALKEVEPNFHSQQNTPFIICNVSNKDYLVPFIQSSKYQVESRQFLQRSVENENNEFVGRFAFDSMIPCVKSEVSHFDIFNTPANKLMAAIKLAQNSKASLEKQAEIVYDKVTTDKLDTGRLRSTGAVFDFEKLEKVAADFEKRIANQADISKGRLHQGNDTDEPKLETLQPKRAIRKMTKRQ